MAAGLMKLRDQVVRLQASTRRAREKAGEVMDHTLTAAETIGTSFAFGLWEGRISDPKHFELAGMPVPLVAGIAAHAFALLGVGRGMESHFHSVGNGALSAHLNGLGRRMGEEWKRKQALPLSPTAQLSPGGIPPVSGAGVTEASMRALV